MNVKKNGGIFNSFVTIFLGSYRELKVELKEKQIIKTVLSMIGFPVERDWLFVDLISLIVCV